MTKIYKYKLNSQSTTLDLPHDAMILDANMQDGHPCIWVMFNEANENIIQKRKFLIFPTGHSFEEDTVVYVASIHDTPFVWHVFEDMP